VPYALYAGSVKGLDTKLNISDTAAMLKPYFTAINLKANIESPTFTGTVKGITKAMVGLANADNTSDLNKPISTATQAALDLKANASDVTNSLANKVDKVTGKELSTNDYTTAEKTKLAAITGTNTGDQDLSALAVTANVNAALALKANTADVNTALALKANTADVNTALALKANTADVNTALALKANTADMNTALALKANTADMNTALALKANTADVNTALALKANTADMNTALALKANTADMNTALALKANTADVNTALALKANTADMNTALGLRELIANKSINVTTDAASDTKYPSVKSIKTYVDAQVAGATIADASESVKGKIQLAGDIAGSAAVPTVPGLLTKENLSNKSESVTTDGASNTKYPTVKSVKDYVDAQIAAIPAPRPTALATDEFVASAGQTSFTLNRIPSSKVSMFVNGIRIPNAAYSFVGTALTFDANNNGSHSLVAGDRVQFDYSYLDN
jgi:hypothetical protein